MKASLVAAFFLSLSVYWLSGCATQADLQAEQKARDTIRAQMADSRASIDDVRREIETVRGQVEELRHRLDRIARERTIPSPQVEGLEARIAALEKQLTPPREAFPPPVVAPPAPPSTAPSPVTPPPPVESPPVAVPTLPAPSAPPVLTMPTKDELALAKEPPEVQDEYRLAWQSLNDQQYDKAIQQFRTFQRKNPTSELADDAQYWIGESYFVRKDYNRAILEFNDVLKYRRGDKVPAALLRQAQAFVEIGDKTDARLILQKLINDYPNSEQAKEAREKLQTLGR